MDMGHLVTSFSDTFAAVGEQVINFLPRILAALLVMLLGWLTGRLVRAISTHFIKGLDQMWGRLVSRTGLDQAYLHLVSAKLIGDILFWFIILVSIFGAAQILFLGAFTQWVSGAVSYLPSMLAGILIIILGVALSRLLRSLVEAAAVTAHISQAQLLGRSVQILMVTVSIIVGVTQLGIDVSFITTVTAIALAAIFGSIGLAFGLGARNHVSNLVTMQQLRKIFKVGDEIRLEQIDGRILEFTQTMVILETRDGNACVPAALFMEKIAIARHRTDEQP